MIYVLYVLVAIGVVFLSMKASDYVDLLDKTTSLSGAFIGGVMLSAVTSLPELFTSISATVFLDKPGLCMGNILGSNLLNITVLSIAVLLAAKTFAQAKISQSHTVVSFAVLVIYGAIILNQVGFLNVEIATISVTSLIIAVLYIFGVRHMSSENGGDVEESEEEVTNLTLKQIVTRFILVSIGIIVLSIVITYITDEIATRLHLGAGLAGALFLGIATSLPEIASTFVLVRKANFNIAIGNIIGSNIFNFMILFVVDLVYFGKGVYDFSDQKTIHLMTFGTIGMVCMLLVLNGKQRVTKILAPLGVVGCYVAFLAM